MTIKSFFSNEPGWLQTSLQETYGGQELRVNAGYEMQELITWWREWKDIMKNQHPSVQDAINQVKVMHTLSKEQKPYPANSWTETTL